MSSQPPVFESSASYYDSSLKKWKTGTFRLTEKVIQFDCDGQSVNIPLNTVSGIERKQSSFIYAAVVVSVAADKLWFASFSNRDSVYNLMELFWRESLLGNDHKSVPSRSKEGSTNLGKDLINILRESEHTLVNAANSLSDQGKQIEETQATVDDINTDLYVAEKFIKNMSFTQSLLQLSRTKTPEQQEPQKCFKVSFTFIEPLNDNCSWGLGTLFIGETISIVDENKAKKLSLEVSQVISCEVLSSWKFRLLYSVEEVERSCYIMCPKLMKLLKCLRSNSSLSNKISFLEDTCLPPATPSHSSASPSTSYAALQSKSTTSNRLSPTTDQVQDVESVISDEDIQELSSMLNNLQELAAEVNREQQSQMDKIDSLMSNVERTELRIKADSKKIKKLT